MAKTLYEVLGIGKNSEQREIRKAYYTLALKHHPDRSNENTQDVFAVASFAYGILGDPEKREEYDRTGLLPENPFFENKSDCNVFKEYLARFVRLSEERVAAFEGEYVGSPEEEKDLIGLYMKHGGDMKEIVAEMFFSEKGHGERYIKILEENIEKGTIESCPQYTKTRKYRKRRAKSTGKEEDLTALIAARHGKRASFLQSLEEKYCKNKKHGPAAPDGLRVPRFKTEKRKTKKDGGS
ncbi:MAG: DnaJ-domain-containing protein [Amphiamblys sp. WSBS2006]|nr:MAG: DnaJ-domain-containing protein [Amphiamblys sp. WSBS2006]